MTDFWVVLETIGGRVFDALIRAENEEDASEQAQVAYPDAEVVKVSTS